MITHLQIKSVKTL